MSHPQREAVSQLRREMGFWDVLLFNIAAVLGPRWIAAAAHNGTSSLSLWVLAAVFFFFPTALVITELSSRFPSEGGLYIWTREAFGDFHGFVAGWAYWVYSFFYFPGLLVASTAMSAYIGGLGHSHLANDKHFLVAGSLVLLAVAVGLNIVGLNIGKWLQNAGGVGTYAPLLILIAIAVAVYSRAGSHVHLTRVNVLPTWDFDTVNFWSQIAFAFTGLELVCAMSEEVHNPRRTFPRAILGSGVLIALIYILGTLATMVMVTPADVDPKSGVFQAITSGSHLLGIGIVGVIAALLVTVGNAGGVGTTVAGIARVPFAVGIDSYLPAFFGKIHPRWRTPYIAILIQAGISAFILVLAQISETVNGAYQVLVDAAIILYFLPFLYMYAAAIKLAYRADRNGNADAVLIPWGRAGVWIVGLLGFFICLLSMVLSMIPPGETTNKAVFELKLIGGTSLAILIGLALYWTSSRKRTTAAQ
ncbi:MAG TPA: APC family permease [Terriglobales bacterium]|nr:APC family permease [Terriglobales bacterium]